MNNLKTTYENMYNLIGQVVQFNEKIESDFESNFDRNMRARIEDVKMVDEYCYEIIFDFSEFVQYNHKWEKPEYYDKLGQPTLRWSETNWWPKNLKEDIYIGYEDYHQVIFQIIEEDV